MKKLALFLFVFGLSQPLLYGQSSLSEAGLSYIRNYTPKEYGAHSQNWAIVQDRRGVMYFGNTAGILEYDGVSWRLLDLLGTRRIVFSLALDASGTIFVGSFNELGFLAPDSVGQLRYVSILDKIEEKYRNLGPAWETHATDQGVYFRTPKYVILLSHNKTKVWQSTTAFHFSFYINGRFYVNQKDIGLTQLVGDSFRVLSSGENLPARVTAMLPYDEEKILIADREQALLLYDNQTITRFPTAADELLRDSQASRGVVLADGRFALATDRKGVLIFDKAGILQTFLDKSSGLQDDSIHNLYVDREGGLWLAMNNGISRVEIPSPLSFYNERLGLRGKIQKSIRHQGILYTATSLGVFFLNSSAASSVEMLNEDRLRTQFKPIRGVNTNCWDLLPIGQSLLVGTSEGIYDIRNQRAALIGKATRSILSGLALHRSQKDSNRVYVGMRDGLASICFAGRGTRVRRGIVTGWVAEDRIDAVKDRIRWLAESDDGALWLCTPYEGVLRVEFPARDTGELEHQNPTVVRFDTSHGLPAMTNNQVFVVSGQLFFATSRGIFIFDDKEQHFRPNYTLGKSFTGNTMEVFRIAEDKNRNLWMILSGHRYEPGGAIYQNDGTYEWINKPFSRFWQIPMNDIYPDVDGIVWLGSADGLIRYDASVEKNYNLDYAALVRQVSFNGDSVMFGGTSLYTPLLEEPALSLSKGGSRRVSLPYASNALRFEYAAPSFIVESANRFQYFLQGFDKGWSDWTEETKKDYTNVPEGDYRFRVRAKNVYEYISSEDVCIFEILPPWHRTWWAYGSYVFLFAGFVLGLLRWRSIKHEQEKQHLEQIISERTAEIDSKNQQLEEQTDKLKEMDHLKSRFFANISHEFRTPLTLIIDPLREMIANKFKGHLKGRYEIMLRNSQRLLRLINQLLDLSKLNSGMMTLAAAEHELVPFLKGVVSSFESQVVRQKIRLLFIDQTAGANPADAAPLKMYFDREKMEQIIYNLLSNAFKYTPEGGEIWVTISTLQNDTPLDTPSTEELKWGVADHIQITVTDTGAGIPEDRLPFVFDRFYQADASDSHKHEGTGIGLALTKELVELHQGEISVESQPGQRTKFRLRLPLGRAHLRDDEIIDTQESPLEEPVLSLSNEGVLLAPEIEEAEKYLLTEPEDQPSEGSEGKTLILVVEDNADVRVYIRQHLQPLYKVAEAKDGAEGVDIALETIPDLIISDVMMPSMDGYELCRVLKSDVKTSHIPVILLTAKASEEHKIEGLETGADDYLIKPFNSRELLVRVKNLIELRRQLQQKYRREFLLQPTEITVTSMEDEFLHKVCAVVEQHLSDAEFTVENLSRNVAMSRMNLHRKLRALTNQTASQFIRSLRLKRAAQLLRQHAGTVTEIAFEVGFTSSAYFTKCFKKQFGRLPSDYIQESSWCRELARQTKEIRGHAAKPQIPKTK